LANFSSIFWGRKNESADRSTSNAGQTEHYQSSGYDSDLARDIQQIRGVLDGYSKQSWLKEMAQNADDAQASRLEFVWTTASVDGAKNPLLASGPALIVLNDGPFTAKNARALRKLGSSDRNADDGSIGRFGLGMKSLFHWCEAFFHLSSGHESFESQEPRDARDRPDLAFSPWFHEDDRWHEPWRDFGAEERDALRLHLDRMGLLQGSPWFCLWLPLRIASRDGQFKMGVAPIVSEFPGDLGAEEGLKTVFGDNPIAELAIALPMLKNLRVIRIWEDDGAKTIRRHGVELSEGERGHRPLKKFSWRSEDALRRTWSGRARIAVDTAQEGPFEFSGAEGLFADVELAKIHRDDHWPVTYGTDPNTFAIEAKRVRRAPHAAAYFARDPRPQSSPKLKIHHAAFLPLGDSPLESVSIEGHTHFSLVLHGDFFPDASRTRVKLQASGAESTDVFHRWNRRLLDVGTLPLILDALERLSVTETVETIHCLTSGLVRSELYRENRRAICDDRQWVYCLEDQPPRWRLRPAAEPVYPLPGGPAVQSIAPFIATVLGPGRHATPHGHPRPHPTATGLSAWPDDLAAEIIRATSAQVVFSDAANLDCLTRFLELVKEADDFDPSVEEALRSLAHEALRHVGASNLTKLAGSYDNFLARIRESRKLELDVSGIEPEVVDRLIRDIAGLEPRLGVVVIPSGGAFGTGPARRGTARPSIEDGERLLSLLADFSAESLSIERKSDLASQLVSAIGPSARRFNGPWADQPLFLGRVPTEPNQRLLSRNELIAAHDAGLLFLASGQGLEADLQSALTSRVVIDIQGVSTALLDGWTTPCDAPACLRVLDRIPKLIEARESRARLFSKLIDALPADDINRHKRALRYLLHGRADRFESDEELFSGVAPGVSTVWRRLAERALARMGGGWRLDAGPRPDVLGLDKAAPLKIVPLDPTVAARCLRGAKSGAVDVDDLSEADRRAMLMECREGDFDVVRALPIYRAVDGRLVAIDDNAYWKGEYEIPDGIPEGIVLLAPAKDDELRSRQRKMHPQVFEAKELLLWILDGPDPPLRWRTIVSTIRHLKGKLDDELKLQLRRAAWLPVAGDEPASLEEVVWINQSHDQKLLRDVLVEARGAEDAPRCVPLLNLEPELNEVEFFHKNISEPIQDRFTARERDLKRLGRLLATDERYRLGPFEAGQGALSSDEDIQSFLRVFGGAQESVMPCRRLMEHLCEGKPSTGSSGEGQINQFRKNLLPSLLGELSPRRCVEILRFLADETGRDRGLRDESREWFNRYLKVATESSAFLREILPEIPLLSRKGDWRAAEELSLEADGVADRHLLDHKHADIIKPKVEVHQDGAQYLDHPERNGEPQPIPTADQFDDLVNESANRLLDQARIWASASGLPPETVGGFLALLGDHEAIVDGAKEYLGNRRVEWVRDRLGWRERKTNRGEVRVSGDPNAYLKGQRFLVEINSSDKVHAMNLLGRRVTMRLRQDFDHLWLGSTWCGGQRHRIELRAITPDRAIPGEKMARLLRETTRRLLDKIYCQDNPTGLEALWDELAEGEQLDVAVAQSQILRIALGTLRSLGAARIASTHEILSMWEEAQHHRAAADRERAKGRDAKGSIRKGDEFEARALQDLKELLEGSQGDEPIQELLKAVRGKIHQFEYEGDSVPFELFQNADDAAVEWVRMNGGEAPAESVDQFFLLCNGGSVRVAHNGRPINQHRKGDFDGRRFGYDQDLVKMTQLNWSDKSAGDGVTGQFGLGFKSAFLISDAPRALSGRLGFEIVAGFYPKEIGADRRRELEEVLDRDLRRGSAGGIGGDATLIDLPIRGDIGPETNIVDRFILSAHVLVVFARRLRRCVVSAPGAAVGKTEWREEALPGTKNASIGRLLPLAERAGHETNALVIRESDGPGALLLGMNNHGFVSLPQELPSVWVTAPLRERKGYGLALNARFDLNPGRALLAQEEGRNQTAEASLGAQLGERLVNLFDAANGDWSTLREAMRLDPRAQLPKFWESLWRVAGLSIASGAAEVDPAGKLLRRTLWGENRGFARLVNECDALPTGLSGRHAVLTRVGRIRFAVGGALAVPQTFDAASQWPRFRETREPGSLVGPRESRALKSLLDRDWPTIGLVDVIREELESVFEKVDSHLAKRLRAVVDVSFVQSFGSAAVDDHEALEKTLRGAEFRASDGQWRPAGELLIPDTANDHEEELVRARFAPPGSVLAEEYDEPGREFARACRPAQRMSAPVDRLIQWAWEAEESRRPFVLEYLCGGFELSGKIQNEIRKQIDSGRDGWIRDLQADSSWFGDMEIGDRLSLLGGLGLLHWDVSSDSSIPIRRIPPRLSRGAALDKIHEWSEANRKFIIEKYERATYPDGRRPDWSEDESNNPIEQCKAWLILLIHGALHTMGRRSAGQDAGFLEFCARRRYLDVFAMDPRDHTEEWMRLLERYLEDPIQDFEYYHWMGQFVRIYQLSRWLNDYKELFLRLDSVVDPKFSLFGHLKPKTVQGGVYAPPLDQTLGYGACCVLRELVRAGALEPSPSLVRYCYPPYRRVIVLLRELGFEELDENLTGAERLEQSARIYEILRENLGDRATFGGLYDLPLLRLATHPGDRSAVLGNGFEMSTDFDAEEEEFG